MSRVVVIGCGVVGATIAYELSRVPGLTVTVLDHHPPAQGSTGAALGVLVGVISQKLKGKAWQMRSTSMQRYETLIPELEACTGQSIPFNRQGILSLRFEGEDLAAWAKLVEVRQAQGWQLEILDLAQLQAQYPQIQHNQVIAAVYSPQDRQVDPVALTQALVTAAKQNGVMFRLDTPVRAIQASEDLALGQHVETATDAIAADWIVIAAGLGSTSLTATLEQPVPIGPVLGQALHLRLPHPLGHSHLQPVITGNDVHVVPAGQSDYWVGATVEFPENLEQQDLASWQADPARLETVMQQAIAFCPALAAATIIRTWSGLRPRPEGRPAPVIGPLPGYSHVLLATGHYRNGVLLAPATAQAIRQLIQG